MPPGEGDHHLRFGVRHRDLIAECELLRLWLRRWRESEVPLIVRHEPETLT